MALLQLLIRPFSVGDASFTTNAYFESQRELLHQRFLNQLKQGASRTAANRLWNIVSSEKYSPEGLVKSAASITFDDLQQFVPQLLSELFCEMFVYGQVTDHCINFNVEC